MTTSKISPTLALAGTRTSICSFSRLEMHVNNNPLSPSARIDFRYLIGKMGSRTAQCTLEGARSLRFSRCPLIAVDQVDHLSVAAEASCVRPEDVVMPHHCTIKISFSSIQLSRRV